MTSVCLQLIAKPGKSQHSHAIVIRVVTAVALISASAQLASPPSGMSLSATHHEVRTVDVRAADAPELPQSLGYLEFDWSSAGGGLPGFALLSGNSITRAN